MLPLGELLRARREGFGASIEEAAKWSGIEPSRLAELEVTENMSSTDFEKVCRGLGIAPWAVWAGEQNSPTRSVARFRSALEDPNTLTPADLRLIATASEIGRTLGALMDMQGRELRFDSLRVLQALSPTMQPWEHGYKLGETARARLVSSEGPIFEIESTLTRLGVHVARARFTTRGIEAAGVWESGSVPVILLNTAATRVEYSLSRRAILAHELCHLLHDGGEADIATRATCAQGTGNYQESFEQRARAFAPAFLAPRRQVREWADATQFPQDPQGVVTRMAEYWGLSFEGAIWHSKNCGLIQPEVAERLNEQKGEPPRLPADQFETDPIGFPPSQLYPDLPDDVAPLMIGLAARLIVDAFKSSVISLGRAKELLCWS